jgi:fructokinase
MRIGVDLGGTKIEIIALGDDGVELLRRRVATPANSYDATLAAIVELIRATETGVGARGTIGVGTPGSISRHSRLLRGSNSLVLNQRPIKADLEALLQREVRISNDANCFALSEATDGGGRDAAVTFGVILGTGVGGGIVIDGRLLNGRNAIAGEWGHNPLPWPSASEVPGPACYCGRSGCIETYVSGPGMERDHVLVTGTAVSSRDVVARAASGDTACEATLNRYEERLARSLAHVVNLIDPDVIVLGGGMSNVERLYVNVPRLWDTWIFSDRVDTRLVPNVHGDSSGVRGAAWLWPAVWNTVAPHDRD